MTTTLPTPATVGDYAAHIEGTTAGVPFSRTWGSFQYDGYAWDAALDGAARMLATREPTVIEVVSALHRQSVVTYSLAYEAPVPSKSDLLARL